MQIPGVQFKKPIHSKWFKVTEETDHGNGIRLYSRIDNSVCINIPRRIELLVCQYAGMINTDRYNTYLILYGSIVTELLKL